MFQGPDHESCEFNGAHTAHRVRATCWVMRLPSRRLSGFTARYAGRRRVRVRGGITRGTDRQTQLPAGASQPAASAIARRDAAREGVGRYAAQDKVWGQASVRRGMALCGARAPRDLLNPLADLVNARVWPSESHGSGKRSTMHRPGSRPYRMSFFLPKNPRVKVPRILRAGE